MSTRRELQEEMSPLRSGLAGIWIVILFAQVCCSVNGIGADLSLEVDNSISLDGSRLQRGRMAVSFSQTLRVMNFTEAPGSFLVAVSRPLSGGITRKLSGATAACEYQIVSDGADARPLRELFDGRMEEVLTGQFFQGERMRLVGFTIRVLGGAWLEPGYYTDSVTVQLFAGTHADPQEIMSQVVTISLSVPQRVELALVPSGERSGGTSGSVNALDFGDIVGMNTRAVDCFVLSNTRYRVSLSSETGGVLEGPRGEVIPYVLHVDGVSVPLPKLQDTVLPRGFLRTGESGRAHHLSATIFPEAGQAAGTYRDSLRVSVWGE